MDFELRDWRAFAVGWGSGLCVAIFHGVDAFVPCVAIVATLICRSVWRS